MASQCEHCKKEIYGILDHIRAKHGFKYYVRLPDDYQCRGTNVPPAYQDDWGNDIRNQPKEKDE